MEGKQQEHVAGVEGEGFSVLVAVSCQISS